MKLSVLFLTLLLLPYASFANWGDAYPGCANADITIGDQVWASCNAVSRSEGSDLLSGWFLWGQTLPTMLSKNGATKLYEEILRSTSRSDFTRGPCATGYRIPTRYEWESIIFTSRRNGSTVAAILSLPLNGSRVITRDAKGKITNVQVTTFDAAYWTSSTVTFGGKTPMVMHIGQRSGYNRYDTTDGGYSKSGYGWQWKSDGKELVESSVNEIANVRCIRDL